MTALLTSARHDLWQRQVDDDIRKGTLTEPNLFLKITSFLAYLEGYTRKGATLFTTLRNYMHAWQKIYAFVATMLPDAPANIEL
ncbi:hypothetical protein QIS74_11611 [Colletotrichum tabaci]|uniref:Uncharacterized protein n=1 Tax=Colletotrichum tabaci TaxID=1209068 RepID=A0AAV9SYN1_9PEZI